MCCKPLAQGMTCTQHKPISLRDKRITVALSAVVSMMIIVTILVLTGIFAYPTAETEPFTIVWIAIIFVGLIVIVAHVGSHTDEISRGRYAVIGAGLPWSLFSGLSALFQVIAALS